MGNGYSLRLFTKTIGSQCQADFDAVKHLGTPRYMRGCALSFNRLFSAAAWMFLAFSTTSLGLKFSNNCYSRRIGGWRVESGAVHCNSRRRYERVAKCRLTLLRDAQDDSSIASTFKSVSRTSECATILDTITFRSVREFEMAWR